MAGKSKRANKVRTAGEFTATDLARPFTPPRTSRNAYSWSLSEIMAARDAQIRGSFELPQRLAVSMRTDDALAVARANRLAPQRCIKVEIAPARRGAAIAKEAVALFGEGGSAITAGALADINGCLVDHGVAFAQCQHVVRNDGSRTDLTVTYWPIENVRWDAARRCYVTHTSEGVLVDIVHGDGRWIVFSSHDYEPFKQDAAVLSGAIVWARHAFAIRDWSKGSVAHGSAKVVGEMPQGVALQAADGSLTAEAGAFISALRDIATSDAAVAIRPAGSKTEFVTNNSSAWQVWTELVSNAEKAAARIYLGTDGTLGASGGAPGVDIESLFGVAATKVQGDLAAISRGLASVIDIWTAINFGDSSLAPTRRYMVPDGDADAARASVTARLDAFHSQVEKARANGFVVDQDYIAQLAETYDVTAPMLPPATTSEAPAIALAPPDLARVVSVNEARASHGLGPLMLADGVTPSPDGSLTVEQFAAKVSASATPTQPTSTELAP
jgi:hypothetical protein